jgi:protein associated with RNAse G/E
MTGEPTRVMYTKYDGSLHWHQTMALLGEDEHGVWLGAPAGMVAQKGTDGPLITIEFPHVILFPRDGWWTAAFNGTTSGDSGRPEMELYCDITSPPRWPEPGLVTMIDLDLDVVRTRADGRTVLLDEDEFAEHQVRYAYPPEVISSSEESARWLLKAVEEHTEPFGSAWREWLAAI